MAIYGKDMSEYQNKIAREIKSSNRKNDPIYKRLARVEKRQFDKGRQHTIHFNSDKEFQDYQNLTEWESKHNPIEKRLAYMRIMEYIEEQEWQVIPPILEEVFCVVASGTELSAREDTTSSTQIIPGMINVSTMEYAEQLIKYMEEDLKIYFGV